MKEEIFDVVNDQDIVLEQKTRQEVHRLGLKHRAVHVFIFNQQGQIFLQKRSALKDNFPGTWDSSCSGHLDSGEEYDACAERELREEISCATRLEKLFKVDACGETGQEFVWLYRGFSEGPFQLQPEEIECGGWYSPAEVSSWIQRKPEEFAPAFVFIWRKYLESSDPLHR